MDAAESDASGNNSIEPAFTIYDYNDPYKEDTNDYSLTSGDIAAIGNGADLSALTNMDTTWPDDAYAPSGIKKEVLAPSTVGSSAVTSYK